MNIQLWNLEACRKLCVFVMSCLMRIMQVTRRDRVRNLDITKELNIEWDIVDIIQTERLRYWSCWKTGATPTTTPSPLCQNAWHETHRKTRTALSWQHRCRRRQTWSHRRWSNARSSTPTTIDEIQEDVRACNFCIAMTLYNKKN